MEGLNSNILQVPFYVRVNLISNTKPRKKIRKIEVWKKKKQDETGHFPNGIQCAAMTQIPVSPFVSVPCFRCCTNKHNFDLK